MVGSTKGKVDFCSLADWLSNGEGREVAETCSKTACSVSNEREGPQMSGHHKPLLSSEQAAMLD